MVENKRLKQKISDCKKSFSLVFLWALNKQKIGKFRGNSRLSLHLRKGKEQIENYDLKKDRILKIK